MWKFNDPEATAAKRNAAIRAAQTEEVRAKKSKASRERWADPEYREKMRKIHQERQTPESKEAARQRSTGRRHTEAHKAHMREVMVGKNVGKVRSRETREKLSKAGIRSYENGRPLSTDRRVIYRNSSGWHAGVWMRCLNSEGVCARQMDQAGIRWEYEPQRFKLSLGTYTPDFYLPDLGIWLEVKGYMRPKELEKIKAFREETGKTLVVVMQKELESMKYE